MTKSQRRRLALKAEAIRLATAIVRLAIVLLWVIFFDQEGQALPSDLVTSTLRHPPAGLYASIKPRVDSQHSRVPT